MINVGVIGVGYLGRHHARVYSELEGVRLAAVVDSDRAAADRIAAEYGGEACSDYLEILGKVDALSIVTPTTAHFGIAMECLKLGKHLLIEKPITVTVEEADSLIEAAEKSGSIIQVGHLERFNPVIRALYPFLGDPVFIEAERLSPFQGRGIDVDITLDLMIHDIDIVLSIMRRQAGGKAPTIRDIKATGSMMLTGNIDIARAWLEFEGGVQALMTANRLYSEKSRKLRVFQEDSYFVVDYQEMEIRRFFREGDRIVDELITVEKKEPLKEELRDFIECIAERRRPVVSAAQGRDALKVALQINSVIAKGLNALTL